MGNQEKNGKSREKWEIKRKTEIKRKMFFLTNGFWESYSRIPLTAKFRPESIQYCFSGIIFKKLKKQYQKRINLKISSYFEAASFGAFGLSTIGTTVLINSLAPVFALSLEIDIQSLGQPLTHSVHIMHLNTLSSHVLLALVTVIASGGHFF
jgi:hypothetical protein